MTLEEITAMIENKEQELRKLEQEILKLQIMEAFAIKKDKVEAELVKLMQNGSLTTESTKQELIDATNICIEIVEKQSN